MVGMVMTKRVSVTGHYINSRPLFKRGGHFVASFLHFCCRWRKKRAARGGFARSGALGLPGAGHGLAGGVLCVGYSSIGIGKKALIGLFNERDFFFIQTKEAVDNGIYFCFNLR